MKALEYYVNENPNILTDMDQFLSSELNLSIREVRELEDIDAMLCKIDNSKKYIEFLLDDFEDLVKKHMNGEQLTADEYDNLVTTFAPAINILKDGSLYYIGDSEELVEFILNEFTPDDDEIKIFYENYKKFMDIEKLADYYFHSTVDICLYNNSYYVCPYSGMN